MAEVRNIKLPDAVLRNVKVYGIDTSYGTNHRGILFSTIELAKDWASKFYGLEFHWEPPMRDNEVAWCWLTENKGSVLTIRERRVICSPEPIEAWYEVNAK